VADLAPGASTLLPKRAEPAELVAALRRLPLDEQIVLELYYWERMTAGEIAEALGDPEGSIRTRIRRAKAIVREALERGVGAGVDLREEADFDAWVESIRLQWADG
jgi:RNA polymerase sigma-70 factor (ECF subfamily)